MSEYRHEGIPRWLNSASPRGALPDDILHCRARAQPVRRSGDGQHLPLSSSTTYLTRAGKQGFYCVATAHRQHGAHNKLQERS